MAIWPHEDVPPAVSVGEGQRSLSQCGALGKRGLGPQRPFRQTQGNWSG